MQPQYRAPRSRISWVVWLVPVALACCLGVFLLAPALPGVVLRIAGFMPKGSVDTFWESVTVQVTPFDVVTFPPAPPAAGGASGVVSQTPTPVVIAGQGGATTGGASAANNSGIAGGGYSSWFQNYSVPSTLSLSSTSGSFSVNTAEAYINQIWFGPAVDGYPLGVIEYGENALAGICSTWLRGCATDQFSVSAVDFRPNGLLVTGLLNVGGLTQPVGLALTLGADSKSLVAQGLVINGQLYAVPVSGDIATYVNQVVAQSNQALGQLQVQAGGYTLGLVQIRVSDTALALIFR
jgi:hypothetical protein